MSVPRDAPCPCGSGKKYKNCCQRAEQREAARAREHRGAVERALGWLEVRHPRAVTAAIEQDFLADLDPDRTDFLDELPPELADTFQVNALEWVLAQGEIEIRKGGKKARHRVSDLILGAGGPLLLASQRAYLEELARSPLRIYEVVESRPGEGLVLQDLLASGATRVSVQERLASAQLVAWEVFAARVVPVGDHLELSGAIYGFGSTARELVRDIRGALAELDAAGAPDQSQRLIDRLILASWLRLLTTPAAPPVMVDQGSGDPLMLITDHYDVLDWGLLAGRLEAEPDVEGDRREGWTRFVELGGDMRRSRLAINIGKQKDRIEPFARTSKLADEGRAWLERVAGDSIRFVIRDIVDPVSIMKRGGRDAPPSEGRARPQLSPDELTRFHQQFAEKHYRTWTDERIPALGDRTPREALSTESGRAAVVDLLKDYESMEARRARQEDREPVDFSFLWAQVGLDRNRELTPERT